MNPSMIIITSTDTRGDSNEKASGREPLINYYLHPSINSQSREENQSPSLDWMEGGNRGTKGPACSDLKSAAHLSLPMVIRNKRWLKIPLFQDI